jgi:hypothetical protein
MFFKLDSNIKVFSNIFKNQNFMALNYQHITILKLWLDLILYKNENRLLILLENLLKTSLMELVLPLNQLFYHMTMKIKNFIIK